MIFPRARGVDEDLRGFLSRRRNRMLARDKNIYVLFRVSRFEGNFTSFKNLINVMI